MEKLTFRVKPLREKDTTTDNQCGYIKSLILALKDVIMFYVCFQIILALKWL